MTDNLKMSLMCRHPVGYTCEFCIGSLRRTEPAGSAEPKMERVDALVKQALEKIPSSLATHSYTLTPIQLGYVAGMLAKDIAAQSVELPPLPAPKAEAWGNSQDPRFDAYTAEQMRDYARASMSTQSTHQPDVSKSAGEIDMAKERERFEKWYEGQNGHFPSEGEAPPNGDPFYYFNDVVDDAWKGWQARALLAAKGGE